MDDIVAAIAQYAIAYRRMEILQRSHTDLIPIGDQKTGVIAEFYSRIYVKHRFRGAVIQYGSASQHVWDIKVVQRSRPEVKIQVKAVSAHSKSSRVSPIHPGWDELWLIRLDENFLPSALWIIEACNAEWSNTTLKGGIMPAASNSNSGSARFRCGYDDTNKFREIVASAIGNSAS